MEDLYPGRHTLQRSLGMILGTTIALLADNAAAVPITYVGFTVTDGQLASWSFHNARVFLKFGSDRLDFSLG
jgi:hypothetical protein